ncbi:hypothetical protein [Pandoraea sputorum]
MARRFGIDRSTLYRVLTQREQIAN